MEQENMVLDVSVELDGQTYTASYFIENGVIHANIADCTYRVPLGPTPPRETVRSLLTERLRRHNFRQEMTHKWFGEKDPL